MKKHGVSFADAEGVFTDSVALHRLDADWQNEGRFIAVGMGRAGVIMAVVYTILTDNAVKVLSRARWMWPLRRHRGSRHRSCRRNRGPLCRCSRCSQGWGWPRRRSSCAGRLQGNGVTEMVIGGKSVYNHLMNTPFVTAPVASSGEDVDGRLEADIRRLEAMVPQMAAAARTAEIDARARLVAFHAQIAQDITTLRKGEACVPSSR